MSLFKSAVKKNVKLKMALIGPSGSGKTFSALRVGSQIAKKLGKGRIALLDTENESASLYSDKFPFQTLAIKPPFTTIKYLEAINAAVAEGFDVLIIDSISHQWNGEGGILQRKEALDRRPGSNSYTNWSSFTPEHNAFISALLQSPIHIIACARSKQDYAMSKDERTGKSKVEKLGMAPVQRDGVEYEMTLVFDIDMEHQAKTSKDRTDLFDGMIEKLGEKHADMLCDWLVSDKAANPEFVPIQVPAVAVEQVPESFEQFNQPVPEEPKKVEAKKPENPFTAETKPTREVTAVMLGNALKAAEPNGWKAEHMKAYIKTVFNVESGLNMTKQQYDLLVSVVKTATYGQALAEVNSRTYDGDGILA